MPKYYDYISMEMEDINDTVACYLLPLPDGRFKFCASPQEPNTLNNDPLTFIEKYWPIPNKLIGALINSTILFPDNAIRMSPLTRQEIRDAFGFNPTVISPHQFGKVEQEKTVIASLIAAFNMSEYELQVMSNRTQIQQGVLYIKNIENNGLQYTVKNHNQVITDTINATELAAIGISVPLPKNRVIKTLQPKLSDILNITSKRAHSQLNKKLKNDYIRLILDNISNNSSNQIMIINAMQDIAALVQLLLSTKTITKNHAIITLSHLALNTENKIAIREEQGIAPLISLLSSSDIETKQYATLALNNLAVNTANKIVIREEQGIAPLISLLSSSDIETKYYATTALSFLSYNTENKIVIREEQGIAPLISLLSSDDIKTKHHATIALHNLAFNPENKIAIREQQGIAPLISLLSSEDIKTRHHATIALHNLAFNPENKIAIREQQGIAPLISLLSSSDIKTKRYATLALYSLSFDTENKIAIREQQGIASLISLLSSSDIKTKRYATLALYSLSFDTENRIAIKEEHGIAPLINLLSFNDINTKRYAAIVLYSLSFNPENKIAIRKEQGIAPLISLLSSSDIETKRYAMKALCSLTKHRENCDAILLIPNIHTILKQSLISDDLQTKNGVIRLNETLAVHQMSSSNKMSVPPVQLAMNNSAFFKTTLKLQNSVSTITEEPPQKKEDKRHIPK